jgi:hypothetical protein
LVQNFNQSNKKTSKKITCNKDIKDTIGSSLLYQYGHSPFALLSSLHPEYEWLPWKFERCPNEYWDNVNNQKKFVEWAGKQFNVKEMSDWYKVSTRV